MGNTNSNPFNQGGEIMSDYTVSSKNQELFLTFLTHKRTGKESVLRQLSYTEQRQFTLNLQRLKNRKKINNKHLTFLQRIEERNEDHMCSHFHKIYTLWQYSNKSLFDQIKARGLQRKPFENKQLWSILACSIMGLAALQEKDIRHECLTSKSILMEDDGNIKIVDPAAISLQTNFECIFNNRNLKNIYLSPEQCQAIQSQKPIINKNPYKNDVFTLGMILLECGLLERQDQCYLDDCSKTNWSKIEANISRFGHIYEEQLRQMINLMLNRDIRVRPDWLELNKFVSKDNHQETPAERTMPSKNYFITRTVKSFHLNKKKNDEPESIKIKQNSRPKQVLVNYPVQIKVSKFSDDKTSGPLVFNNPTYQANNYATTNNYHISLPQQPSSLTRQIETISAYKSLPMNEANKVSANTPYQYSYQSQLNSIPTYQKYPLTYPPEITLNQELSKRISNYSYIPQKPITTMQFPNNSVTNQMPPTFGFEKDETKNHFNLISQPGQSFAYQLANIGRPTDGKNPLLSNQYQSGIRKGNEFNNFSPITISEYIRPAQSVNYEVVKANSPSESKNEKPQIMTYPFDLKLNKTPQIIETSSIELQPQYVEEHFKIGSRYEGYKLNGMRNGRGKFYYQDGGFYDGEWKNNRMQGYGTLYYQSNHKAYEGIWVNDQFHGVGKLYNDVPAFFEGTFDYNNFDQLEQVWQYYEGNFEVDEKDGNGKLQFSNGEVFQGTFKKDMIEGEGYFYCLDGVKIHGIWKENHLVTLLN